MDILAMNMDEINRYVDDAMRDNPLIELLSPPEHFAHYSDWDAERQDAFDRYSQQSAGKTLEAFLLEQIASLKLDESARSAVVYIICSMDENGYVYGTVPGDPELPTIGLIAHMDTAPDAPGQQPLPPRR